MNCPGQLIPQIFINYRRHNATGLQASMMMLWAWAGVPLGVYNIVEDFNVALQIQPQLLTFLSLLTWIQCYYYNEVFNPVCQPTALTLNLEMDCFPCSARSVPYRHGHGRHRGCTRCFSPHCQVETCRMAVDSNGHSVGSATRSRRAQTLLRHLVASYRERHLVHLRVHRCTWRFDVAHLSLIPTATRHLGPSDIWYGASLVVRSVCLWRILQFTALGEAETAQKTAIHQSC